MKICLKKRNCANCGVSKSVCGVEPTVHAVCSYWTCKKVHRNKTKEGSSMSSLRINIALGIARTLVAIAGGGAMIGGILKALDPATITSIVNEAQIAIGAITAIATLVASILSKMNAEKKLDAVKDKLAVAKAK